MLGYLGFDGFTSTFQEKLFKGYKMSPHHQVLFVTLFSSCFALFSLLLGGMLGPALGFVSRHPSCIGDILLLSTTAVASQFIIAFTIKSYGALVFAAIMTTRQFVSILVSNVIFGHPMSGGQWVGLAVVFGTLYAKIQREFPYPPHASLFPSSTDPIVFPLPSSLGSERQGQADRRPRDQGAILALDIIRETTVASATHGESSESVRPNKPSLGFLSCGARHGANASRGLCNQS